MKGVGFYLSNNRVEVSLLCLDNARCTLDFANFSRIGAGIVI